jgi:predicted nucleic acid-binding protein
VSAFVDTNVLIRHLTGDPPDQAARAPGLLSEADRLLLPDLIVAETVDVLESFYEVPRLDFADAYLLAQAETSGVNAVISFDKRFERVPTVRRVEP